MALAQMRNAAFLHSQRCRDLSIGLARLTKANNLFPKSERQGSWHGISPSTKAEDTLPCHNRSRQNFMTPNQHNFTACNTCRVSTFLARETLTPRSPLPD